MALLTWPLLYNKPQNINCKLISQFSNLNKNYFILGCNFGPYNTKDFFDIHKNIVVNAKDVCFRDIKSYNLSHYLFDLYYITIHKKLIGD